MTAFLLELSVKNIWNVWLYSGLLMFRWRYNIHNYVTKKKYLFLSPVVYNS